MLTKKKWTKALCKKLSVYKLLSKENKYYYQNKTKTTTITTEIITKCMCRQS